MDMKRRLMKLEDVKAQTVAECEGVLAPHAPAFAKVAAKLESARRKMAGGDVVGAITIYRSITDVELTTIKRVAESAYLASQVIPEDDHADWLHDHGVEKASLDLVGSLEMIAKS